MIENAPAALRRRSHYPSRMADTKSSLADPDIDADLQSAAEPLARALVRQSGAKQASTCLCEKPIALTAEETQHLIDARDRTGVKIGEAFMVRTHPLWLRVRELVATHAIGDLRSIVSVFILLQPRSRKHPATAQTSAAAAG